jgi:tRNA threonylcarbamoyladenosine biosynthesis protein TsaE
MWEIQVESASEMIEFGKCIAVHLRCGDIIALYGPLGAGKTTLIQGIAEGLGVGKRAVSPTFILVREYVGRLPLFHVDAYRLEGIEPDDVEQQLAFSEYLTLGGVIVIEWAEHISQLLPSERLDIFISHESVGRRVRLVPLGKRYVELISAIRVEWEQSKGR